MMATLFEGIGMISMSRFTLHFTVTNTIPVENITNLRLGFIVLGSTQMCSALILVNVLIFAIPLSTTQVVISGLAGVSIIFFSSVGAQLWWFFVEVSLWIIAPILGMLLALLIRHLMQKHIFEHSECRKRILVITPYYMTFAFFLMVGMPLTKNYLWDIYKKGETGGDQDQDQSKEIKGFTVAYAITIFVFPFLAMVIFRFMLLRRAR